MFSVVCRKIQLKMALIFHLDLSLCSQQNARLLFYIYLFFLKGCMFRYIFYRRIGLKAAKAI